MVYDTCQPVLETRSGPGTGETLARTASGWYSVGPVRNYSYPAAEYCRCSGSEPAYFGARSTATMTGGDGT